MLDLREKISPYPGSNRTGSPTQSPYPRLVPPLPSPLLARKTIVPAFILPGWGLHLRLAGFYRWGSSRELSLSHPRL